MTEWKDGIPKEIKNSTDKDKNYKARDAWFQLVSFQLYKLTEANKKRLIDLSPKIISNIKIFEEKFENQEFSLRDTTEEDINLANKIIDEILAELEQISNKPK